jgi:hypothetical protein
MSTYVDPLADLGCVAQGKSVMTCHMFGDSDEVLHEMAARICLSRSWFRPARSEMHLAYYELTGQTRAEAVKAGAIEVDKGALTDIVKRYRLAQSRTVKDLQATYSLKVESIE